MPTSTPQQPTDDWQAAGALEGVDEDVLRAHSVRQLERVHNAAVLEIVVSEVSDALHGVCGPVGHAVQQPQRRDARVRDTWEAPTQQNS